MLLPTSGRGYIGYSRAYDTMLENRHRRSGPIPLTTALVTKYVEEEFSEVRLITSNTKITHLGDVLGHTSCLQLRQSRAYPDQKRRHGCEESDEQEDSGPEGDGALHRQPLLAILARQTPPRPQGLPFRGHLHNQRRAARSAQAAQVQRRLPRNCAIPLC